jgi:hypothetical protein
MPHAGKFLRDFGFYRLGSRPLVLKAEHIPIVRFQLYKYHFKLAYPSSSQEILSSLKRLASSSKIINSEYGNPYRCTIQNMQYSTLNRNGKTWLTCTFDATARKIYGGSKKTTTLRTAKSPKKSTTTPHKKLYKNKTKQQKNTMRSNKKYIYA